MFLGGKPVRSVIIKHDRLESVQDLSKVVFNSGKEDVFGFLWQPEKTEPNHCIDQYMDLMRNPTDRWNYYYTFEIPILDQ